MIQWVRWLRIVFLFEASAAKRLRKDLRKALEREAEAPVLTGESSLTEFSAAEYDEFFGWLASKPIVPPYKFDMSAARLLTPDLATRMYGPVFTWLCFGDVVGDGFEYWPDRKKKL